MGEGKDGLWHEGIQSQRGDLTGDLLPDGSWCRVSKLRGNGWAALGVSQQIGSWGLDGLKLLSDVSL